MGNNWKHRKRFIRDWCIIWIAVISFVILANVMLALQVHCKKCEDKLINNFQVYCEEILENKGVYNYE